MTYAHKRIATTRTAALAITALLAGRAACIEAYAAPGDLPKRVAPLARPSRPATVSPPQHAAPALQPESSSVTSHNAGFASSSVFSAAMPSTVMPDTQTLSGPVTLTYGGSAPAFLLTDSGTNRGLSTSITNSHDANSVLYGATLGSGAGMNGVNLGTAGPGGRFQVINASSAQAGAFVSTNGTGPAVLGSITNKTSNYPAVYGQSLASTGYGIGVEGNGNLYGVSGSVPATTTSTEMTAAISGVNASNGWGAYGRSSFNGSGVGGFGDSGFGVSAFSQSNYAVYALTATGTAAIYVEDDSDSAVGFFATTRGNGNAIHGVSNGGFGVYGETSHGRGVSGTGKGSSTGVFGTSQSGLAGQFQGNVKISGELIVGNTVYTSDRNLKSDIQPIDAKELLARVSQLPISSWHYISDPDKRHVGPMAQDFYAAFGLNGVDDRHISEVDIGGVSLAAIHELNSQMKIKDSQMKIKSARIAALKMQLAKFEGQAAELQAQAISQAQTMAQMQQTLSARMTALPRRRAESTQTLALEQSTRQRVVVD